VSQEFQDKTLNELHEMLFHERGKLFMLRQYGEGYKAEELEVCKAKISRILTELEDREGVREQ